MCEFRQRNDGAESKPKTMLCTWEDVVRFKKIYYVLKNDIFWQFARV